MLASTLTTDGWFIYYKGYVIRTNFGTWQVDSVQIQFETSLLPSVLKMIIATDDFGHRNTCERSNCVPQTHIYHRRGKKGENYSHSTEALLQLLSFFT